LGWGDVRQHGWVAVLVGGDGILWQLGWVDVGVARSQE
jgi:hypothetical protein